MKTKQLLKNISFFLLFAVILCSCNDDDEEVTPPVFDAPTIDLSQDSGEFRIGQTIRLNVAYEASALFREFVVLRGTTVVERITYPDRTLGEDNYTLEFLIDESLLGSTQTFTFSITDTLGESVSATFTATVSEVAPTYQIRDIALNGTNFKQVTGRINFDETFNNEDLWLFKGEVTVEDIATLTIEEGTAVFARDSVAAPLLADSDSITIPGKLQVQIGGTLLAEGTAEAPIVFNTINAAPNQPEAPEPGDWEGVELLGDDTPEGNSGILKYVRIENGGDGDEPLQLRQVGGNTLIDFVQVHNADDTGIRMRGGYVNLKHILITKPDDRGIRYSDGWEGNGQFWVVVTDVDDSIGLNGRDSDDSPRNSDAIMSNITLVGPFITGDGAGDTEGVQLRDGAKGEFHNTVVTGFDNSFRNRSEDGDMIVKNSIVFGNGSDGDDDGLHSSIRDAYREAVNNNSEDPITLADTFIGVGTANASDAASLGSFFDAVSYVGAVAPDNDWTLGWTLNFDGTPRE
ncbi:MAG: hypothetical protein AAGF77_09570 [Bacteroidota bacterium]